jgi:hypothetical protein
MLAPVVSAMRSQLLAGSYIQTDETPVDVQTHERRGKNHQSNLWHRQKERKNWIHIGRKQAAPRVAAILSVVESCRRLRAS